ncbi:hypothetical protein D3C75_1066820 [compost metagenome]
MQANITHSMIRLVLCWLWVKGELAMCKPLLAVGCTGLNFIENYTYLCRTSAGSTRLSAETQEKL